MATTTYEEEKKRVERPADLVMPTYAPPTNTATQQAQAEADAFYNELRQRYAQAADPAVQAAQDARIQRGRQFWTGANLFANVIANAINASGTAKGAPNMTWNDASTQKMYDTWKDADARLRAERKEAQQRYDAMGLQQQQMRLAAAQAQDRADLEAYNRNFAAQQEADRINYNNQWNDYRQQQADDRQLDKEKREDERWKERNQIQYNQNLRLANIRHSGSGSGSKGSGDYSISLGSIDIPAKDKKEAEKIRKDIANKIVDRYNKGVEERNAEKRKNNKFIDEKELEKPLAKPKNNKESEGIIYQLGDMYDDDTDFRKDINSTYGIEDIYAEGEPVAASQPQYGVPWYQPQYGMPAYSTPSAPAPSSSASASGVGQRGGQYQDGGYFLGSRQQPANQNVSQGHNAAVIREGQKRAAYKVEGNRYGLGKYDGGYVGTQRAPHELTEEEKELIKKNGEKPKINY